MMIGPRTITEHVIHAAAESVDFMSRNMPEPPECYIALLVPKHDGLKRYANQVAIVEGDEADVLSRFEQAFHYYKPDFVVRLTGDNPLIPSFVISKHVRSAIYGSMDYVNNRWHGTAPDGHDCEVVSKRLMRWVFDNARRMEDKEHVTTLIRRETPDWARIGHVIGYYDMSDKRLTVDTLEDLEVVRAEYARLEAVLERARTHHKQTVIYRL